MANDTDGPGGTTETESGQTVTEVMDRLEELRADEGDRSTADEGILLDQLDEVEGRLLAFGEGLGGEADDVTDLPFTEEAGLDHMPEPLYVRHDTEMLNQVTSWLLQDQHIGLVSPYGTGKSAFREIVLRDLSKHDDFVVTHLDNPRETTARSMYQTVLEAAYGAGYSIKPGHYSQVRNGIPWATAEAKKAVHEVLRRVRADGKTLLLVVDEIEVLTADLLSPLQVAGDAGVRLFLTGTPDGKRRVAEIRGTLDSRLRYYENIDPFSPDDIAEYVARSLAYFRGQQYRGESPDLFTREAIEDIHERTDGNPREVRIECRELFTRAAFVWYRTGQDIDRIQVTPDLRHRRFGMGY
ncbi:ATP-binding protein [Haloarcula sp. S1CR25-12]|uniref:ATP-binding protein n=2 Tax=Haloarcula saliterrae TaxID=2950534 RepID=A0ABU2FDP7_9EURY|nr:ATP-binding protein [Haloarcula sp. S1CR25-12]